MNTKLLQVILLGLIFTIGKVTATEISPSAEVGHVIIGKDANPPKPVPQEILEEVILELEDEISNVWHGLLGGVLLQLILFLLSQ